MSYNKNKRDPMITTDMRDTFYHTLVTASKSKPTRRDRRTISFYLIPWCFVFLTRKYL